MLSFPVPGLSLKINYLVWDERILYQSQQGAVNHIIVYSISHSILRNQAIPFANGAAK